MLRFNPRRAEVLASIKHLGKGRISLATTYGEPVVLRRNCIRLTTTTTVTDETVLLVDFGEKTDQKPTEAIIAAMTKRALPTL